MTTINTSGSVNHVIKSANFNQEKSSAGKKAYSLPVSLSDCTEVHSKVLERITPAETYHLHYTPTTNEELGITLEAPEYTSSITPEYAESVARLMLEFASQYNRLRQVMIDEQVMTNLDLANLLSVTIDTACTIPLKLDKLK